MYIIGFCGMSRRERERERERELWIVVGIIFI
jgi:hypothetical protein